MEPILILAGLAIVVYTFVKLTTKGGPQRKPLIALMIIFILLALANIGILWDMLWFIVVIAGILALLFVAWLVYDAYTHHK